MNPSVNLNGAASIAGTAQNTQNNRATEPETKKFSEVWNNIQTTMGAKPKAQVKHKKELDKDDFLRIMITQMQNQDPTEPFKADQIAGDMAKIASLEQMKSVGKALDRMADQNKPLEKLAMTNMIGKTVTVDKSRFPHEKGTGESLTFTLPSDASSVQIALVSEKGEVVLEKALGEKAAGTVDFSWDGNQSNLMPANSGTFFFRVMAKDASDRPIQVTTVGKAKVIGVSFKGGEPVLMVGNGSQHAKVKMSNVIEIENNPDPVAQAQREHEKMMGTKTEAPVVRASPQISMGGENSAQIRGLNIPVTSAVDSMPRSVLPKQVPMGSDPNSPAGLRPNSKDQMAVNQPPSRIDDKGFPNGLNLYKTQSAKGGDI